MADIDEREFDFGNPPAQGGPEADNQGEAAQIPELTAMIDGLCARWMIAKLSSVCSRT